MRRIILQRKGLGRRWLTLNLRSITCSTPVDGISKWGNLGVHAKLCGQVVIDY